MKTIHKNSFLSPMVIREILVLDFCADVSVKTRSVLPGLAPEALPE